MADKPETQPGSTVVTEAVRRELKDYREWIEKYRLQKIGEVKMQKIRLQLGTYAQRQEGVQMQRIKFPGGAISSDQLLNLADVADKYASGFIHWTTREDAQLYYINLDKCPDMMLDLASAGITTREACGNTVRNITACYRSGVAKDEVFDVTPYAHALFRFLVRNKFNQVMGRKFKIAFEGCAEDHAGMRFHDMGFKAMIQNGRRGFRTYVGGGLGGTPMLGQLYSEFLPEEELFHLAAATVRLFDRYGERKNRMAARMKFLVKKLGWDKFKQALDEERKQVKVTVSVSDYLKQTPAKVDPQPLTPTLSPEGRGKVTGNLSSEELSNIPSPRLREEGQGEGSPAYETWKKDNLVAHRVAGFVGVNVRLRLGDLLTDPARKLAEIARIFSRGELRISIWQNLFLPWVPEKSLPALYQALSEIKLADSAAETIEDTTTCPGADTCRLGITSAKGLGAAISSRMNNGMARFKALARGISVKISGCPNGCAQHGIANIGFQGAALTKDGKTVPAHELFVGGGVDLDNTSFGERIGKFPARNCDKVVGTLLELYDKEKQGSEGFNRTMTRVGKDRIREILQPLAEIPSFDKDPDFYQDWGHENEKFAVRTGIKGECAGATVQEKAPVMADAREKLAQAEAFLMHKEFQNAQIEAYEAAALAARVPLYAALCDPFTSEQSLWEFENIFVRSGRASSEWLNFAEKLEAGKKKEPTEAGAKDLIGLAKKFFAAAEKLLAEITVVQPPPLQ